MNLPNESTLQDWRKGITMEVGASPFELQLPSVKSGKYN